MEHPYIIPISELTATLEQVGGKGASLNRLAAAGFPVPPGFTITTAAYQHFISANDLQDSILTALQIIDLELPSSLEQASQSIRERFSQAVVPPEIANAIVEAYANLSGQNPPVAVRSSATAEDLPEASFAGQQETYLNISQPDALLEATRKCWASLWTARAISYRARQGISPDSVSLAVVVQQLVPAEAAGILFTADPVSGDRQHVVISAAWGLGEAVVGGMVTPDNVTVEKASKKVISRQTADKQVMTVRVSGGTQEQPVPQSLREVPVLSDSAAADLTELAVQIEQLYRQPMDIEWALADGQFAIVQARPITALPEFDAQPLLEWNLPEPKGQYMRASICELMSDPLSPLFASLGLSAIENGINVMAKEMFGLPIDTLTGFMLSINGYAYQKVSYTGRQWLQLLARMGPRVPRLLREGVPYWQNVAHPHYAQVVKKWKSQPVSELSPVEIWNGVQEIMAAYAQHIGSLMVSTMGPSAGSEGIFTQVYDKMVMRPGDPPAPAFLMGYDSLPIKAEKALYDLSVWCREQPVLAAYLADNEAGQVTRQLTEIRSPDGLADEIWDAFCSRFQQYLEDYGYSIYDMDFAKPLPLDDPEPILETLKLFISGQARDPYQRQQAYVERRQEAMAAVRARLRGFKRWAFEKSLKWAQSQAPLREDGIVEIGLGYPVLRRMLLDLGRRFAEADVIQQASDIFWLEQAEVEASVTALEDGETPIDRNAAVQERHALWKERKRLTPPAQLPPKMKVLGMNWESILAVGDTGQAGGTIKGVAASPGQVKGTARVLHGPADFDQMQPGDVLVAAITTPAWTPLFAMASAVVTDIGGPLSHGSIVAREYGIPAVLGTGVATKRIQSGQRVTVDGCAGVVSLDGLE